MNEYASQKVTLPAIGLMVSSGLGIAYAIFNILMNLFSTGVGAVGALGNNDVGSGLISVFSGVFGIVFAAITILSGAVTIFGAVKMKGLSSYNLAMVGAILAMVPCVSPCCCLGLPLGIWAIVVLMDPEVKKAFDENAAASF